MKRDKHGHFIAENEEEEIKLISMRFYRRKYEAIRRNLFKEQTLLTRPTQEHKVNKEEGGTPPE